ncbi:10770_t:CDS:2, partial [Gigaspora margarita]
IDATIRNALEILKYFNYKKAKTREFNKAIENQEVPVQHTSIKEKTRQDLTKKKEILLVSECETMDYGLKKF